MAGTRTLSEIEARIGIIQDNIRQLIEQATATSGAESEALVSDRIAQQTEELERLTNERDALAKKTSGLASPWERFRAPGTGDSLSPGYSATANPTGSTGCQT